MLWGRCLGGMLSRAAIGRMPREEALGGCSQARESTCRGAGGAGRGAGGRGNLPLSAAGPGGAGERGPRTRGGRPPSAASLAAAESRCLKWALPGSTAADKKKWWVGAAAGCPRAGTRSRGARSGRCGQAGAAAGAGCGAGAGRAESPSPAPVTAPPAPPRTRAGARSAEPPLLRRPPSPRMALSTAAPGSARK